MEIIYIRAYFVKHTISGWIDTFWHHEGFFTFDVSFHLFIFSFIRRSKKLATRAINVHTAPEHKHRFSIRDACKDFIISLGNCALLKHLCCFFYVLQVICLLHTFNTVNKVFTKAPQISLCWLCNLCTWCADVQTLWFILRSILCEDVADSFQEATC